MENQKNKLGVFPSQLISKMIDQKEILAKKENIQPASIDLSASEEVYRVKGTFLPRKNEKVEDIIKKDLLYRADINKPLEKNGVYVVKLNESLALSPEKFVLSSSKSSTGRVDLQTRLLVDGYSRFDRTPVGYSGSLWLQVIPRSFLIKINPGDKLNQIRIFNSQAKVKDEEIKKVYEENQLMFDENGDFINTKEKITKEDGNCLIMNIDLTENEDNDIIGYKNLNIDQILDFSKLGYYSAEDFFEPIHATEDKSLILEKESFYIFSTKESIRVPRDFSAEMAAYDTSSGEFRSHYAGFFDPGFGYGEEGKIKGRRAVLEVRSFENNLIMKDRQPICQMIFEKLIEPSDFVYSEKIGSHYANQKGPKLSKHFA